MYQSLEVEERSSVNKQCLWPCCAFFII